MHLTLFPCPTFWSSQSNTHYVAVIIVLRANTRTGLCACAFPAFFGQKMRGSSHCASWLTICHQHFNNSTKGQKRPRKAMKKLDSNLINPKWEFDNGIFPGVWKDRLNFEWGIDRVLLDSRKVFVCVELLSYPLFRMALQLVIWVSSIQQEKWELFSLSSAFSHSSVLEFARKRNYGSEAFSTVQYG